MENVLKTLAEVLWVVALYRLRNGSGLVLDLERVRDATVDVC